MSSWIPGGLVVPRYTWYPALPDTAFQVRLVVTGTPVAPLAGETSTGGGIALLSVNSM